MNRKIIEIAYNAYKKDIRHVDEVIVDDLDFYANKEDIEKVNELLSFDNFLEIIKREIEEGLTNAYDELLTFLKSNNKTIDDILCLDIEICGRNDELYEDILEDINSLDNIKIKNVNDLHRLRGVFYNDGYGAQVIYGFIVFKDKTFAERDEYDGAESWRFYDVNELIQICKSNQS